MSGNSGLAVLCVCTGNICRSPAAERLLARSLGPSAQVSSGGTRALVGQPISPPMAELITAGGAESAGFAASQLTERRLRSADLVLTMTLDHRGEVVELCPAVVRRSFTLREFSRLIADTDPAELGEGSVVDRLRNAVAIVGNRRRRPDDPSDYDIADPYRRGDVAYRRAFGEISAAVGRLVDSALPSTER